MEGLAIKEVDMAGYRHSDYARSLTAFGEPLELRASGGWILRRTVSGTNRSDAMGCYPIFGCLRWESLPNDLSKLEDDLIAVSIVADPWGDYSEDLLRECFPDVMRPFKSHFIVELNDKAFSHISGHHRRNIAKAIDNGVAVYRCEHPLAYLQTWCRLYANLTARHSIGGIAAFSSAAFAMQMQIPGTVLFRGELHGKTVGMVWWFAQNDLAYYHLGAYTAEGYKSNASFAIFWHAFNFFRAQNLKHLSLGAGAGIGGDGKDGLTRFKSGWATGIRQTYFCGRVYDRRTYERLIVGKKRTDYFPAYRSGEFGT